MKKVIEEYTPQKLGPHTTWVRNGTAESVFVDVTNSRTLT